MCTIVGSRLNNFRIIVGLLLLLLVTLPTAFTHNVTLAAPQSSLNACDLTLEIISAPYAIIDSNKAGIQGPQAATLGVRLKNDGATALENLTIAIGDGQTAGVFKSQNGAALALLRNEAATRTLDTLASGESSVVYWAVTYPMTFNRTYEYKVSVADNKGCDKDVDGKLTPRETLSTSANKIQPKGSMLLVTPDTVTPGGQVRVRITGFTLGTVGAGSDKAYNAWLQPMGNQDFDPACLRLVRSEIKLESLNTTPFVDTMAFTGLQNYKNKSGDYAEYTFVALAACSTVIQPYQAAASGTNEKYNDDYTAVHITITSQNPVTPTPTATPRGVNSGGNGGLESGPLPSDPSAFIGGISGAQPEQNAAAADAQAQTLRWHKARLLESMTLKLDDLMPTQGPANTTPKAALPVDVLAVTTAPDAKAVDFVNAENEVKAVVLGILTVGGLYEHDYGVCNRFKEYEFDTVDPLPISAPDGNQKWFWHSQATKGDLFREEALLFHIFVNESTKQFHIDSRWTKDSYPATFDFTFDYVYNMQVWSNELANSQTLLQGILERLTAIDNGSWQVVYHNEQAPATPQVFVRSTTYQNDAVQIQIENESPGEQPVHIYGAWRSHLDRQTLETFDYQLIMIDENSNLTLAFPGLLDVTLFVESNGFTDKIYTGGGLWFGVTNSPARQSKIELGDCRSPDGVDKTDLFLAGCANVATDPVQAADEAGLGRTLNPNGRPVDISPYKAVRFWAKGNGAPVRIFLETAAVTDNDYHQTVFTPDREWQQYVVPLTQFTQRGFGVAKPLDSTGTKAVIWLNAEASGNAVELSIDQLSFTNHGLLTVTQPPADGAATTARSIQVTAPNAASMAQLLLHYSVDGGATFQAAPFAAVNAGGELFQSEFPAQTLGTDVLYYLEAQYVNDYTSRSPLDAPASYYRYRVDDRSGLLIDDFSGLALRNRLNGGNGVFNHVSAGGNLQAYRADQQLILKYTVSETEQFVGYFTQLSALNASPYTTIDLLARGEKGGEQLRLSLRNAQGVEKYVNIGDLLPGGITTEWQWIQIPLSVFAQAMDLSDLQSLSLIFANTDGLNASQLYVQEIRFTSLATPLVVIDSFDDSELEANAQGLGYWTSAPNSTLTAKLVAGDANKASGQALQLDYNVGASSYAIWNSALNRPKLRADAFITFWAKGANQAIPPAVYLASDSGRVGVPLADYVTLKQQWQLVQIPLSAFATQGSDINQLTGFQIVFERTLGSGSLALDNIQIGTAGAPQADQRTIHLRDVDQQAIALHLPSGVSWQSQSDVPWLFAPQFGAGSTTLSIGSVNWDLAPGLYTGKLYVSTPDGQTETIVAHLTVTQTGAPASRIFLPVMAR